eukprot:gene16147-16325_t
METILWFKQIRLADTQKVGGKNASLGEMISQLSQKGIRVPNGFAITTAAFKEFISFNLLDKKIDDILKRLDISDIKAASKSSTEIRSAIEQGCFPAEIEEAIRKAYQQLEDQLSHPVNVAVRSSAVGEDSKDASFAGQQETYLHVNVGIQQMVHADEGASGVMFTLDTESGFNDVILINASYGLGEAVVQAEGRAVGQKISTGKVCALNDPTEMDRFKNGDILSTDITDPNWEPIMKKASAILTKRGGRTCHAAIVARELGIPALVGCGESLNLLHEGQSVTVSCAEGDMGYVYEGILEFTVHDLTLDSMPPCPVKIAMNVGNPHLAYRFQSTPNTGIGLARLEFIINSMIGIHPMAAHNFPHLPIDLKMKLREKCDGYASPKDFFVEKMAEGISTLAAAFWPKPVIVRLSDFKSNEYRNLIGGELYEPLEENPMIGWRALKRARDDKGLKNVEIMIPFVRTVSELQAVIQELESHSLKRGVDDQFLEHIDGFSIGSNDMTQLTLGVDRDSGLMQHSFDERDEAVKVMLKMAIQACRKANKYVGICGQGPSDYPELAKWLAEEGIESISLNPDTVIDTWLFLAKALQTDQ